MNGNTLTTKNRVGLVLAGALGIADILSLLMPTPDGDVGPPFAVIVLDAVCGFITVAAVIVVWVKKSRGAVLIAAGARIVSMLSALPAFFVDGVPTGVKILVAGFVLVTLASLYLMLSPAERSSPVVD